MKENKRFHVKIGDEKFVIRSDESLNRIRNIEHYVNEMIIETSKVNPSAYHSQILAICSMNITDEYFKLQDKIQKLEEEQLRKEVEELKKSLQFYQKELSLSQEVVREKNKEINRLNEEIKQRKK